MALRQREPAADRKFRVRLCRQQNDFSQEKRTYPILASIPCNLPLPFSLQIPILLATYPLCAIASYRFQWRYMVNRSSSLPLIAWSSGLADEIVVDWASDMSVDGLRRATSSR